MNHLQELAGQLAFGLAVILIPHALFCALCWGILAFVQG